jgi:hypothetical protein
MGGNTGVDERWKSWSYCFSNTKELVANRFFVDGHSYCIGGFIACGEGMEEREKDTLYKY